MKKPDDGAQGELPLMDVHIHRARGEQVIEACRLIAADRGWERSAKELDAVFEPEGRPVSVGTLRNALRIDERNYARMEWLPYFASLSDEAAEVIAVAAGKTLAPGGKLRPEDELELLRERVQREFGAAGARLVASFGGRR